MYDLGATKLTQYHAIPIIFKGQFHYLLEPVMKFLKSFKEALIMKCFHNLRVNLFCRLSDELTSLLLYIWYMDPSNEQMIHPKHQFEGLV